MKTENSQTTSEVYLKWKSYLKMKMKNNVNCKPIITMAHAHIHPADIPKAPVVSRHVLHSYIHRFSQNITVQYECSCPQRCPRSTVWQWRKVTVFWRSWSLIGPTRCGWWLSTTLAALCPARDLPSEPVSPHSGSNSTKNHCLKTFQKLFSYLWPELARLNSVMNCD